jgi:hypothetical protein
VGYHVYRNYELLTPGYIMPPYRDCGGLVADTAYVYGVVAVNASLVEGAMALAHISTEVFSAPLPPLISLASRTHNRLQLIVAPDCDTGGDTVSSHQFMVKDAGAVVRSGTFECCKLVLEDLEANRSYVVLVKVVNDVALSSPWVEATYQTTPGIPATFAVTMLQVNTFSAVVALGSKPYDNETSSFEIFLRQHGAEIQRYTVSCDEDIGTFTYGCPTTFKIELLEHETEYDISVQANGPLGSSISDAVRFNTSDIAVGK